LFWTNDVKHFVPTTKGELNHQMKIEKYLLYQHLIQIQQSCGVVRSGHVVACSLLCLSGLSAPVKLLAAFPKLSRYQSTTNNHNLLGHAAWLKKKDAKQVQPTNVRLAWM